MSKLELSQSAAGYRYSIDSFILADFVALEEESKIIDFGTGNGVIPLLLSRKTKSKIVGLEIQSSLLSYARQNIVQSGLGNQISLVQGDIRFSKSYLKDNHFNVVVGNPPYRKLKSGRLNPNPEKAIARHEIYIILPELIENAAHLLCDNGKLTMIYLPERYDELITTMAKNGLIPKKVRLVYSNKGSSPGMFLIEGVKNGKGDTIVLKPLYIYDKNSNYTSEMKKIYDSFSYYRGTDSNGEVGEGASSGKEAEK